MDLKLLKNKIFIAFYNENKIVCIMTLIFIILLIFAILNNDCNAEKIKDDQIYYMGFLNNHVGIDTEQAVEIVQPYFNFMSEKTGYKMQIKIYSSFDQMLQDFKNGKLHFGGISNIDYVEMKKKIDIIPLVKPVQGGSSSYKAMFITRRDSNYKSLSDFREKTFAYSSKDSSHGYLIPQKIIKDKFNMPLEKFFGKIVITKKDSDSVMAVYYKKADIASTFDVILNFFEQSNPSIVKGIKVISASQPVVHGPIFYYPPNIKNIKVVETLKKESLIMSESVKGKQTLISFKISGFIEAKDSDYDSLKEMFYKNK